jgi:[histone H3]-N6,N6-dimethyl-L-lysine4 FAD-dependent demethylase
VTLYFSEAFWETKSDYIGYLNSERRGEFYLIWNMQQVCNRPVLVALVAGQSAFEIENESDQYVVNKMMKALRKIYGEKIPDPNKFYKTSWHSDPFARGNFWNN